MSIVRTFLPLSSTQIAKARSKPIRFFAIEALRGSAFFALVLLAGEVFVPLEETFKTPLRRLAYVLFMAVAMATLNLWAGRHESSTSRGGE